MEKQTITFADQEIANRLASRKHFLKDIERLLRIAVSLASELGRKLH